MRTYIVCKRGKFKVEFVCGNCDKNVPASALVSAKVCPACNKRFKDKIKIQRGFSYDVDGKI